MPLELTGGRGMSINMNENFIPAAATIADLEQKAAECDRQAATEPEPDATELRERAKLYRAWIAQLRSGRWTSIHECR
jgi:hypothetical protein